MVSALFFSLRVSRNLTIGTSVGYFYLKIFRKVSSVSYIAIKQ
jgi:hypothetical protein